jgi:hypothetical protein
MFKNYEIGIIKNKLGKHISDWKMFVIEFLQVNLSNLILIIII